MKTRGIFAAIFCLRKRLFRFTNFLNISVIALVLTGISCIRQSSQLLTPLNVLNDTGNFTFIVNDTNFGEMSFAWKTDGSFTGNGFISIGEQKWCLI
ncbi:hypothetical protein ACFL7D_11670 [candidate division KSB1 bacterium]